MMSLVRVEEALHAMSGNSGYKDTNFLVIVWQPLFQIIYSAVFSRIEWEGFFTSS